MKTRSRVEVPFEEFEALITQLRNLNNDCSQSEAMRLIGYEGSTIAGWRNSNKVPIVAMNAINWVLHQIGIHGEIKPQRTTLSFEEQANLFGCLQGFELSEVKRKELTKKLATILAEEN